MKTSSRGGVLRDSRRIPESEVRMLWHAGYWDGPLSGMCMVDGQHYWFQCAFESYRDRHRKFWLLELPPDDLAAELERHELFRECVGRHHDYVNNRRVCYYTPTGREKEYHDRYPSSREDNWRGNKWRGIWWFRW